jgi:hypothetical protein
MNIFNDVIEAIERHHSIADLLRRRSEEMFELHQAGNFNPADLKAKTASEKSAYPSTTVVDRGFRREPGASAPGKSANFEGLQSRPFAPFLRQEASTAVVLVG